MDVDVVVCDVESRGEGLLRWHKGHLQVKIRNLCFCKQKRWCRRPLLPVVMPPN